MTEQLRLRWFYLITLGFIALGCFFLMKEFYWIALLPLLGAVLYLAAFSIDTLLLIIVFFTPLAFNLDEEKISFAVSLPTEPLMFGVTLIFLIKIAFEGGFDRRVLYHPVTIMIIINLIWMFITSLTSTMVIVSVKHLLARLWFICPFYFLGTQLFRDYKNIKRFVWLYLIPLLIVISYTIGNHMMHGWTEEAAHFVMYPFYNDHTAYAAAIAMFLPIIIGFTFNPKYSLLLRTLSFFVFAILVTALILSYTRAAWLSLAVALGVFLIFILRIRFSVVLISLVSLVTAYFIFQTQIVMKLEQNRQQSSTDFNTHIQSVTNISTDASNLERINRWHSAIRMFKEKPVFGWGPGTYQFKYAPYQQSKEMTIISTNAGTGGNAHSEYIGPLAESGVLGMITFALIVIAVIWRASLLYTRAKEKEMKMIILGILLGLITYFVHGALNNFLDTDKASVPFWGFIAILVAIDVYHTKESKREVGAGLADGRGVN